MADHDVQNLKETSIAKAVIGQLKKVGMNYLDNTQIVVMLTREMGNQKNYYGCMFLIIIKMEEWLRLPTFQKQIVILQ